jgi:hypothetical protein
MPDGYGQRCLNDRWYLEDVPEEWSDEHIHSKIQDLHSESTSKGEKEKEIHKGILVSFNPQKKIDEEHT